MMITTPPAKADASVIMLGTAEYPLYLVRGDGEAIVFEGGVGAVGLLVSEQIEAWGIDPGTVARIIVTHAHPDHVMAIPTLKKLFPAAPVLGSVKAAGALENEKAVSFFAKIDAGLTDSLLKAGSIDDRHRPDPLEEMTISLDGTLEEGDTIPAGEMRFTVLATPGHSDCSLSFHEPEKGILVISDAAGYYLPDGDYFWPNYFSSYGDYRASLRRLADLDAEILCLSHNAMITGAVDIRVFLEAAIAAAESWHRRIVSAARDGREPRDIAEELGAAVYEKTQLLPLDFFQKNCGVLVKQSLAHEGIGGA